MNIQQVYQWHKDTAKDYRRAAENIRSSARDRRSSEYSRQRKLADAANFEELAKFHDNVALCIDATISSSHSE